MLLHAVEFAGAGERHLLGQHFVVAIDGEDRILVAEYVRQAPLGAVPVLDRAALALLHHLTNHVFLDAST